MAVSDYEYAFVDSIAESPTVRLDLARPTYRVLEPTDFGTPPLNRAVASTLLADGETYPAEAYGNRVLTLVIRVDADGDDAATAMHPLWRELDRPRNILRYRPGTSEPVFFRTFRAGPDRVQWDPVTRQITVQIPAEPFALGLPETLGPFIVSNDPAEPGPDLNANPYFETDAANWAALGGSVARSTTQAHEGSASLLLTPDGVTASVEARAENVPAAAGARYRGSAWVRCAAARTVSVGIIWRDAGASLLSSSFTSVSVSAATWTLIEVSADAPAGTAQAQITVGMGSTPSASHTLHIDEARLRREGAGNAQYVDLTGIKGDVETPLRLTLSASSAGDEGDISVFALRRRGTPSQMVTVLQAEAMTPGTDTTAQAAASNTSGAGTNTWARTAFSSGGTAVRLTSSTWPTADNPDVRGRYRVFARVRTTVATDEIYVQLRWGLNTISAGNPEVSVGWDGSAGSSNWKLVDLGLISFPSGGDPEVDGLTGAPLPARGQALELSARRPDGTGNLDWDYLVFVPADDRLGKIRWADLSSFGSVVIDGASETIYGLTTNNVVYGGGRPPRLTAFPVASPGVTNRLCWLATAGPYAADLTIATTGLTVEYVPRYLYAAAPSS